MKRMTLVLALVLLVLISPLYVGIQIEKDARAALAENQYPGYEVTLEVDRGYRHSTYLIGYGFDPDYFASPDMTPEQLALVQEWTRGFELAVQVEHGPLLWQHGQGFGAAAFELNLGAELGDQFAAFLDQIGQETLGWITGQVSFSGDIDLNYLVREFEFVQTSNGVPLARLEFEGLSGKATVADWGQSIDFEAEYGAARMSWGPAGDKGRMELAAQPLKGAFQRNAEFEQLYTGSMQWQIPHLFWQQQELGLLQLDDMVLVIRSEMPDSERIQLSYRFTLDELQLDETRLTDVELGFAYRSIDAAAANAYIEIFSRMESNDPEIMQQMLLQYVDDYLPQVLAKDPGLALDPLRFSLDGESVNVRLTVNLVGDQVVLPLNPINPFALLYALSGELSVDASAAAVERLVRMQVTESIDASIAANPEAAVDESMRETMIEQQSNMMLLMATEQGFLNREGDRLTSRITLANGLLDINGMQMPVPF